MCVYLIITHWLIPVSASKNIILSVRFLLSFQTPWLPTSAPTAKCKFLNATDILVYRRTQILVLEIFLEATNFNASYPKFTINYIFCHRTNNDHIDFNFIPLIPVWVQLMFVFRMKIFYRFVCFLFHTAGLAENTPRYDIDYVRCQAYLMFCQPCIVIYPYNMKQLDALFTINLRISLISLYMFLAGLQLIIRRINSV